MAAQPRMVADPTALGHLATRLRERPWVALDTEFLRDRTFFPRLCLVQVATPRRIACIDPLALDDLSPLGEVLADPAVTVVLHSARQDLEVLNDVLGVIPARIFDTQVAATLVGLGEQLGYAALVSTLLGVELPKGHARTDWSRRPLSAEVLRYAADDVRYLVRMYPMLCQRLEEEDRTRWAEAEFAALVDPARYRREPREAWRRLRDFDKLRGRARPVARALAAWREETAMAMDIPRRWVLPDDVLLSLAGKPPEDLAALRRLRGVRRKVLDAHGEALLEAVRAARSRPAERAPKPAENGDPGALADALMAALRVLARRARVSAGTLATRRDLERLVAGERDVPVLQGWRHQVAGHALLEFLDGRGHLACRRGKLELQ